MITRETYFNLLASYIDKPFIKIITGLRRSGKSVLLNLLSNELINRGIAETNILLINFESFEFSEIDDAGKLYQYIILLRHIILHRCEGCDMHPSWKKKPYFSG